MFSCISTDSRAASGRGGRIIWFTTSFAPADTRFAMISSMSTGVDQSRSEAFQESAFPFSYSPSRFRRSSAYFQSKAVSIVTGTYAAGPDAGMGSAFFCS
jgi:hypothetical protein